MQREAKPHAPNMLFILDISPFFLAAGFLAGDFFVIFFFAAFFAPDFFAFFIFFAMSPSKFQREHWTQ